MIFSAGTPGKGEMMGKEYTALDQMKDARDYRLGELSRQLRDAAASIERAQQMIAGIRSGEMLGSGMIDLGRGSGPVFAQIDLALLAYNDVTWNVYQLEREQRETA